MNNYKQQRYCKNRPVSGTPLPLSTVLCTLLSGLVQCFVIPSFSSSSLIRHFIFLQSLHIVVMENFTLRGHEMSMKTPWWVNLSLYKTYWSKVSWNQFILQQVFTISLQIPWDSCLTDSFHTPMEMYKKCQGYWNMDFQLH